MIYAHLRFSFGCMDKGDEEMDMDQVLVISCWCSALKLINKI